MRVNLKQTEGIFPYIHGYYKIGERFGEAFHDGLQLKK